MSEFTTAFTAIKQAETSGQIATAIAKKALDAQKQQGGAAVELIKAAGKVQDQASRQLASAIEGLGALADTQG